MSRKTRVTENGSVKLPEPLRKVVLRAAETALPTPDEDTLQGLPHLWSLLAPQEITLPGKGEDGGPKTAIREPLLTLGYSLSQGTWQVGLTDRLLRWRATFPVRGPLTALLDVEAALASGMWSPRKLKKRLTSISDLTKLVE